MNYELRLPPDTQNEIRDYLDSRFTDSAERSAAITAIDRELKKLEVNPALGIGYPGGPFEARRIYRFSIVVGGITRSLQVAYAVRRETHVIVISGFAPLAL